RIDQSAASIFGFGQVVANAPGQFLAVAFGWLDAGVATGPSIAGFVQVWGQVPGRRAQVPWLRPHPKPRACRTPVFVVAFRLTVRSSRRRFVTQSTWQVQLAMCFAPLRGAA